MTKKIKKKNKKIQKQPVSKKPTKKSKEYKVKIKINKEIKSQKIEPIKEEKKDKSAYGAKDIYVLEGLEPVRRRPGMYIGSTGAEGIHHLIWEVVDNSLDEAMGGYAKNIEIVLLADNRVQVTDDGRGIPVDIHPQTKKSALETVLTTLHAGGKFGGDAYKISGGLHGVGVSVVCALSKWMKAEVCREGHLYRQEYSQGKPKTKVVKDKTCTNTGTTITFEPDPEIFKEIKFDWKKILNHLRQQAYLVSKIRIKITDARTEPKKSYEFYFEGGLGSYIKYLNEDEKPIHPNIFYVAQQNEGMMVEAAMQYTEDIECHEESFANNIFTGEGGMHLTGLRSAITRTFNDYARKNELLKEKDENLTGDDVREGLTAVVAVKIREPQFEGQTKAKLGNPEARTAVEAVVSQAISEFLERNSQDARIIIGKCILAVKARKAAKAAKDSVLRKGAMEGFALPGKLADCSSRKSEDSELFLVEGDSAGGSCKMARDRQFQAILPLRGKILNVERARIDKILSSQEVRALIIAMGVGIGEEFDVSKLRYHKIVIMADADSDGNHIRTLLLTLFYRHYKPLIEDGHIFIAQPPLYRIQAGKRIEYAYTEDERLKVVAEIKKDKQGKVSVSKLPKKPIKETGEEEVKIAGISIQRYKGLGEMNPGQLWETTMDPKRRILKKVMIEDAKEADHIFDVLMGEEVAPRKKFIQAYAKRVKNLDI